jgi:hypothetical protein
VIEDKIAIATARTKMLRRVFEALARGASAAKKSWFICVTLSHSPGISLNGRGDASVEGLGDAGEDACSMIYFLSTREGNHTIPI